MVKKFLALALAATAMVWAAEPVMDGGSLIGDEVNWAGLADNFGSSVSITSKNPLIASFELVKSLPNKEDTTETNWVWAEVSPGYTADFSNLESIEIEGTFSKSTRLTLVGIPTGVGAFINVLSGTVNKTIEINTTNFAPSWGSTENAIDLSKMTGISFTSGGDENCIYEINITKLILHTTGGDNPGPGPGPGPEPTAEYIELISDDEEMQENWEVMGAKLNNEGDDTENLTEADGLVINSYYPILEAKLPFGSSNETDDIWAWVSLSSYIAESLEGLDSIIIEYEADEDMAVVISMPGDHEFSVKLSKSNVKKTVTAKIGQFSLPSWDKWSGSLDLTKADGISFAPHEDVEGSDGKIITIKLHSVKVYGVDDEGDDPYPNSKPKGAIAKSANIAVTGISAGKLGLNVPSTGNYSIAVYSVDGRMLAQTKANLVKGINTLPINKNLAHGIAVVRVQGANTTLIKKISIR
ncbi:MAG: T9SS type A sorting domain-containing protein [Chitinispirillales bacterium]|jgi:hypothetical protein|nr:T9SS type A sorting domain-containing protein [Chitinispirillales bacterium]